MKTLFKYIVVSILTWEAQLVLRKYKPRVIAVTGSVGKTMTKDAIFSVLASSSYVRKSEKSYNSETGVPLTILGRPSGWESPVRWAANLFEGLALILLKNHYPSTLVLEVGADRPGDVVRIAKWLAPDIVVLTRFPDVPAHVEFFDSVEKIVEEKSALVRALPGTGTLVYNSDDLRAGKVAEEFRGKSVGYGLLPSGSFVGRDDELLYDDNGILKGMRFRLEEGERSVSMELHGAVGRQYIYSALAAVAVGSAQNVDLISAARSLSSNEPPPGRMRLIAGIKETTIIDDTYNASPAAMTEALATLDRVTAKGRKVAVLADMLELGEQTIDEHRKAGMQAASVADILLTVGIRARSVAEGALSAGMPESAILQYEDAAQAGRELQELLEPGDVVLVKGSQKMRMERVVEEVMRHPERKKDLLVRQDAEWLTRT